MKSAHASGRERGEYGEGERQRELEGMRWRKRRREIKGLKRWRRERVRESNSKEKGNVRVRENTQERGARARRHTLKEITHKLPLPALHTSECWRCVLPCRNKDEQVMFVFVVFAPRTSVHTTHCYGSPDSWRDRHGHRPGYTHRKWVSFSAKPLHAN